MFESLLKIICRPQGLQPYQRETPTQLFSCEICEDLDIPRVDISVKYKNPRWSAEIIFRDYC